MHRSNSSDQGDVKRLKRLRQSQLDETRATFEEEAEHYPKRPRKEETLSDPESDDDSAPAASSSMPSNSASRTEHRGYGDAEQRRDHRRDASSKNKRNRDGSGGAGISSIGEKLMAKMGYAEGEGLGARGQGRVDPVSLSTQRGRVGLGHEASKVIGRDMQVQWDESEEEKTVEEFPKWIEANDDSRRDVAGLEKDSIVKEWMLIQPKKLTIDDETQFVDPVVLKEMLKSKEVFDNLSDRDLREARTRANPYETIGSAFFQNRAAMKTANLDKVFDWIFSLEDPDNLEKKNPVQEGAKAENTDRSADPFYFADVCAGPGGFSEYMLWRKGFYNAKGFGFTLKGKDDFKLGKFTACSAYYFEPYYGAADDGDVTNPENIDSLEDFIMRGTNNGGVDLMMADGGFSVDGQENIQEILSKRLYLCQLLVSLCIVKDGGNFFCKLFDVFTPFSVGLVFLLYACYDKISIHKPHTSRPANSERYLICKGLRREEEVTQHVKNYLKQINRELDRLGKEKSKDDIASIVPMEIIRDDEAFVDYIIKSNDKLAKRQTMYLRKYLSFAKNQGQIDTDQVSLRDRCLQYWQVPNRNRNRNRETREQSNPDAIIIKYTTKYIPPEDFLVRPPPFSSAHFAADGEKWLQTEEYYCSFLSERAAASAKILISTGDAVFIRSQHWERQDNTMFRIPGNTILLVECTTGFRMEGSKLVPETQSEGLIRVLDAAVLGGDDISAFPFVERHKAIQKFTNALRLVERKLNVWRRGREEKITPFRLNTALAFKLNELGELRSKLSRLIHKGEEVVVIDEEGVNIIVRAVRGVNFLAADSDYGPRAILEEDTHLGGPTINSLMVAIQRVESRVGKISPKLEPEKRRESL